MKSGTLIPGFIEAPVERVSAGARFTAGVAYNNLFLTAVSLRRAEAD